MENDRDRESRESRESRENREADYVLRPKVIDSLGAEVIHAYHPDLPNYHPKQVFVDGCTLCEALAEEPFLYAVTFGAEEDIYKKIAGRIAEVKEFGRKGKAGEIPDQAAGDEVWKYDHLAKLEIPLITLLIYTTVLSDIWNMRDTV